MMGMVAFVQEGRVVDVVVVIREGKRQCSVR